MASKADAPLAQSEQSKMSKIPPADDSLGDLIDLFMFCSLCLGLVVSG